MIRAIYERVLVADGIERVAHGEKSMWGQVSGGAT